MQGFKIQSDFDALHFNQPPNSPILEGLTPLIKCVKDREAQYFQLLNFIAKNIDSCSSDVDQISHFDRFVKIMKTKEHQLITLQNSIVNDMVQNDNRQHFHRRNPKILPHQNREILRLCSRILQMLDASIGKARNTIINQNNQVSRQYAIFKNQINKNFTLISNSSIGSGPKQQTINTYNFTRCVLSYIAKKYRKELEKIQRYLQKLQSGDSVFFRDIVIKIHHKGSDVSQESGNEKKKSPRNKNNHNSSSQSPNKKTIMKRGSRNKQRMVKKQSSKEQRNDQKRQKQEYNNQNSDCQEIQLPKKSKVTTANRLLKFYALLELNKKEFMEDIVFEKHQQEIQRARIMSTLIQRNKLIKDQIGQYIRKTIHYDQHISQSKLNVVRQQPSISRNQSSVNSKVSIRTSFVIKRRASFHLEHSDTAQNMTDKQPQEDLVNTRNTTKLKSKQSQIPLSNSKSIISPRRRSTSNKQRKSRGLFVVKAPILFEDEMIPKQMPTQTVWNQNAWTQNPLTKQKDPSKRKNEHIRLKKRNNPIPLQNTFLPETFQLVNLRYPV